MILYDRVYYTLYRMTLKIADMFSTERKTPRAEVALMLLLLTGINIIPALFLLSIFTGMPVLSGKKVYVMIMLSPLVVLNFSLIFYKQRYKKIEEKLSLTWQNEKSKNILITVFYLIFTVVFFCLSLEYIKNHALK